MENIALVIITALISGLLATLVTIWWQRRAGIFASKMRIFETLMSYRYMISSEESVKALNSMQYSGRTTGQSCIAVSIHFTANL